jgi:hypothetical protein
MGLCEPLDEMNDCTLELTILDLRICLSERNTVRCGEKLGDMRGNKRFRLLGRFSRSRQTLEEEGNRHLQNARNVLEPASAYAVDALLVFLNLLECKAKCIGKSRLAHVEHEAAHTDATADVFVSVVGPLHTHSPGSANYTILFWGSQPPRTGREEWFDRTTLSGTIIEFLGAARKLKCYVGQLLVR